MIENARFRHGMIRFASILAIVLPVAAGAQTIAPAGAGQSDASVSSGDTIRLSDEERAKILDRNTIDSAAAIRGEMSGSQKSSLQIHGEVGAMIGSNGTRGVYGVADIPLGENAGATVMFESTRYGYRR